jgi:uncharacterized membrane protein YgdD (TMEM256/DUF423 family)
MTGWGWVRVGAVLGFLAVAIGAFGAHGLKARLDSLGTAATFQTGVQYHMYHALAILAVGVMTGPLKPGTAGSVAGWAFLAGVVLFSGSLYVLAVTGQKWLGMIAPFGGVAMMAGWVALAVAATTWNATLLESLPEGASLSNPGQDEEGGGPIMRFHVRQKP